MGTILSRTYVRVKSRLQNVDNEASTSMDSNHSGRVKRQRAEKRRKGTARRPPANSNHLIQNLFVVSRRSLALAPQPPGVAAKRRRLGLVCSLAARHRRLRRCGARPWSRRPLASLAARPPRVAVCRRGTAWMPRLSGSPTAGGRSSEGDVVPDGLDLVGYLARLFQDDVLRGRAPLAVVGGGEDLDRHAAQVAEGLVSMSPTAEVDLGDGVRPEEADRVDQGGELDGVPGGDRELLEQVASYGPLPRQGLTSQASSGHSSAISGRASSRSPARPRANPRQPTGRRGGVRRSPSPVRHRGR